MDSDADAGGDAMRFETEIPGVIYGGPARYEKALDLGSPLESIQRGISEATLESGRHPDRLIIASVDFYALVRHPEWMSLTRAHAFDTCPASLFGCQFIVERRRKP